MAIKHINIGAAANDKTGTPARQAGQIINENFDYLENKVLNVNTVITPGLSVLVGQNLTIKAGWVWKINGQQFSNPEDVVINFPYAATGKRRFDRIVFNTSNTFTKVVGTESVSNPVAMPVPVDTIDFGVSLVTDSSVGENIPPGDLGEKLDKGGYVGTAQTLKNEIDSGLLLKENKANKATDFSTVNDVLFPTVKASKIYTDNVASNKLDKNNAATTNPQAYIKKADGMQAMFDIENILSGVANSFTDSLGIKTYVDNGLSLKENLSNKAIDYTIVNDQLYPTIKGSKTYIDNGLSLKENLSNKAVNFDIINDILYPTVKSVKNQLDTKISVSEKGAANGVGTLDSNGKAPLSQVNDALLGNVKYKGLYNGVVISSSPDVELDGTALPAPSSTNTGWYFIASVPFTNSGKDYANGDWIISNGVIWDRVDNTDAVSTVFGRVGHITAQNGDYTTGLVTEVSNKNYQTDNQKLFNDATSSIQTQFNSKQPNLGFNPEPAFAKNTAFNKNFGTVAGTVAEGNDQRILNGQTAFGWGNHSGLYLTVAGNAVSASKWQTARNFTIGNSLKSVDGSSNMVWTHVEMGVPATDGTYATGTWAINITGNAGTATNTTYWGGRPADLNDVNNSGGHALFRNGDGVVRLATESGVRSWLGLNDGSTLSNSISGNANTATSASTATSAESASRWGSAQADFTTFGASIDQIVGRNTSGVIKPYPIDSLKVALGLGSNAYTSTAYLPLTGGVLTGGFSAPTVGTSNLTIQNTGPYLQFVNALNTVRLGYIQHDSGGLVLKSDAGTITLGNNTSVTGTITASGGFFNSDKRLKYIIKRDGNVAYFKWKDGRDDRIHIGYIAQEVQKTNPDQVIKREDGILSVNYTEMLVLKVKSLENRVRELEGGRHGVC